MLVNGTKLLKRPLTRAVAALLVIYPLVVAMAYAYGDQYGKLFLPLYSHTLKQLAGEFILDDIGVVQQDHQLAIQVIMRNRESRLIGGQILAQNMDVTVSTLLGHALQHLILMATIIFVWLSFRLRPWSYNVGICILALVALLVVETLDIPFVLFGALLDLLYYHLAPSLIETSPAITWMHFLNGGGRLGLSVVAALSVLLIGEILPEKPHRD